MTTTKTALGGAGNTGEGLTTTTKRESKMADPDPMRSSPAHASVALIRSIVNHAEQGREDETLTEVRAVIEGAGIDELLKARLGAA